MLGVFLAGAAWQLRGVAWHPDWSCGSKLHAQQCPCHTSQTLLLFCRRCWGWSGRMRPPSSRCPSTTSRCRNAAFVWAACSGLGFATSAIARRLEWAFSS